MYAVSVTYLSPVVSTGWGIFLHESVKVSMIISIGIILSGVYIITRTGNKDPKKLVLQGDSATSA